MSDRFVRVIGKGSLSVKPDVTRLILTIEGTEKEYADALRLSSEKTEALKSLAEQFGFARNELKTLAFNVDTVYEGYQAGDGSWKQRFTGYRYVHRLKLQFPSDNALLGRLLYALGHSAATPEIGLEYTVSEPEKVKNELLARAVADSKAKAEVLSQAAGVRLGEIVRIDYSWDAIEMVARPANRVMYGKAMAEDCAAGSYDMNIEADDIRVEDTVTVEWAIR